MSETLTDFLVKLASYPDQLKEFLSDPTRIVDQSQLPESDKAAVLSRDCRLVLKALGVAAGKTVMQMYGGGGRPRAVKPPSKPKSKRTGGKKKTGRKKK